MVSVRLWAPDHEEVDLVLDGRTTPMRREPSGHFSVIAPGVAGSRYGFQVKTRDGIVPDPASRAQPDGPHGLSQVVDPGIYAWKDHDWPGLTPHGQVIYELHVGTFTSEGTWRAAIPHLSRLRDLGVTVIQMMPVAAFAGRFGWGYDGVAWFAPSHLFGTPDNLRAFVDEAHRLGLGVILDVVYNHFGPDGNYACVFSRRMVSSRYENEWGDALNYDGPGSEGMRELALSNAEYWIREFHFDGFRFDATQQIYDRSPEHILAAVARRAREAARPRDLLLAAENEPQHSRLIRPCDTGGYGLDLLCNEDFHHTSRVLLTGIREAYYTDYRGTPQELLSAVRWGFLFQGQHYSWQKNPRGAPALDLPPSSFVAFLENHDQAANAPDGRRLSTLAPPGLLRAMTALLLLMPATPLLFQGQETGSDRPFHFFADHEGSLGEQVREGRRKFLSQFARYAHSSVAERVQPSARETFASSVLDHTETARSRAWFALHRDLLGLRRTDPVLSRTPAARPEGAVLTDHALLLRWFDAADGDRLLLINTGSDVAIASLAEPLLAPPAGHRWRIAWSSESVEYGGAGALPFDAARWTLQGQAATWVVADRTEEEQPA